MGRQPDLPALHRLDHSPTQTWRILRKLRCCPWKGRAACQGHLHPPGQGHLHAYTLPMFRAMNSALARRPPDGPCKGEERGPYERRLTRPVDTTPGTPASRRGLLEQLPGDDRALDL